MIASIPLAVIRAALVGLLFVLAACESDNPAIGGDCDFDRKCGADAVCEQAKCRGVGGTACDPDRPCGAAWTCRSGQCVAQPGGLCSDAIACAAGATCEAGTCRQGPGAGCADAKDCAGGLVCVAGKCLAGSGGACAEQAACAPPLVCAAGQCVEADGCGENNGGCDPHAKCLGYPGGRFCVCERGFDGDGTTCTDVDECATGNGGCPDGAECENTDGSRVCRCRTGFEAAGTGCTDVDECATAGRCGTGATCVNTRGSFTCACNAGFVQGESGCIDVDECATNHGGCDPEARCENTIGGRTCTCPAGFEGDGVRCADVDECASPDACGTNATCLNTAGSFSCRCHAGFVRGESGCVDVDECGTDHGGCFPGARCENTIGDRTCTCPTGFEGDGVRCSDVDECASAASCAPDADCTNLPGSHSCRCRAGFDGDGTTCVADPLPSFTSTPPDDAEATVAIAYEVTAIDTEPVVLSVLQLPAGAVFDADTGVIAITIATPGVYPFVVRAAELDAPGRSTDQAFELLVRPYDGPPVFTSEPDEAARAREPYAATIVATDEAPPVLVALDLPDWLAFDPVTGKLSGTPTDADVGPHDVVVEARDADKPARAVRQAFTIVVASASPFTAPCEALGTPAFYVGQAAKGTGDCSSPANQCTLPTAGGRDVPGSVIVLTEDVSVTLAHAAEDDQAICSAGKSRFALRNTSAEALKLGRNLLVRDVDVSTFGNAVLYNSEARDLGDVRVIRSSLTGGPGLGLTDVSANVLVSASRLAGLTAQARVGGRVDLRIEKGSEVVPTLTGGGGISLLGRSNLIVEDSSIVVGSSSTRALLVAYYGNVRGTDITLRRARVESPGSALSLNCSGSLPPSGGRVAVLIEDSTIVAGTEGISVVADGSGCTQSFVLRRSRVEANGTSTSGGSAIFIQTSNQPVILNPVATTLVFEDLASGDAGLFSKWAPALQVFNYAYSTLNASFTNVRVRSGVPERAAIVYGRSGLQACLTSRGFITTSDSRATTLELDLQAGGTLRIPGQTSTAFAAANPGSTPVARGNVQFNTGFPCELE